MNPAFPMISISRNWPGLSAFVLSTLLAVSIPAAQAAIPQAGKVIDSRGTVHIHGAEAARPAAAGAALFPGDVINTGADGWAAVMLADETLLQINRNTSFTLKAAPPKAGWLGIKQAVPAAAAKEKSRYEVKKGEVWLRNKDARAAIDIETPTVTGGVRGTELSVRVLPDGAVNISVLEGEVAAWNDFGSVTAAANEQIHAIPGAAPVKRILIAPRDAVLWTIPLPRIVTSRDLPLLGEDRPALDREKAELSARLEKGERAAALLTRLGMISRDLGDTAGAVRFFNMALEADPRSGEAMTGLGWAHLDMGDPAKALELFAAATDPGARNYMGRSVAHAAMGAYDKARSELAEGERLYPDFEWFKTQEAFLLLAEGDIARAHELLTEQTAARPGQALSWSLLSITSLARDKKDMAAYAARGAVAAAPGSPTAHLAQSHVYQAMFDIESALGEAERAAGLDEKNILAIVNVAKLLFSMDYTDRALEIIREAESAAPYDAEVLNLKGFILMALRKTSEAKAAFEKSISLDPGMGEPRMGLSLVLMRKGDMAGAMEQISAAALLEPRNALFLSYWAKMLYQLRRFEQALDMLEYAARIDPRDPTPHLYRSLILRDMNRPTQAVQALNLAIALNDNRAVYRSRFLLDRDLAVKNVDLSILYNQLGLSAWAASKALASVKSDYTNSAGHLFLAGAFSRMDRRVHATGGELLLGHILQPANINSYNTFNEYTSFFEQPGAQGVIDADIGEQDTKRKGTTIYGAHPGASLSFSGGVDQYRTEGWSGADTERKLALIGNLKWEATPKDRFTASYTLVDQELGGGSPRYEYDTPPSEGYDSDTTGDNGYIGYHRHFGPGSDLIVTASFNNFDIQSRSSGILFSGEDGRTVLDSGFDVIARNRQAQAQYLFSAGGHQIIAGTVQYTSSQEAKSRDDIFFEMDGLRYPLESGADSGHLDERLEGYYLHDIWKAAPSFTVEAAGRYNRFVTGEPFTSVEWEVTAFEPWLGVIWTPTGRDTLRAAAFRYLMPGFSDRVDPMDIAGIPVYRNSFPGSINDEVDVVWEREWKRGFFSVNLYYTETEFTFKSNVDGEVLSLTHDGSARGAEVNFNMLLWLGAGLRAGYSYLDIVNRASPSNDRYDHTAMAGIKQVFENGLSLSLDQTYRRQEMRSPGREAGDVWITDAQARYELPRKAGALVIEAKNIFDSHFNWVVDDFTLQGRAPARRVLATLALYF